MTRRTKLSKLRKGQYFKFTGRPKVYRFNGKVRMYNNSTGAFKGWGYSYEAADDINSERQQFKDSIVTTGFNY